MGLAIVIIVGMVLGWLFKMLANDENHSSLLRNMMVGIGGAMIAALVAGDVPLAAGISGEQLIWSVMGGAATLAGMAAVDANRASRRSGNI